MLIDQTVQREIDKIVQKIGKQMARQKQQELKQKIPKIISYAQSIAESVFKQQMKKELQEIYGPNFNENNLLNSYSIKMNGIHPEISLVKNREGAVLNTDSIQDDIDEFNIYADKSNINLEDLDFEIYNEYYGDADNIDTEKIQWNNYSYYNKRYRRGTIMSPLEALETAKVKAMNYFYTVEIPKLKIYSKKQLGIDIF